MVKLMDFFKAHSELEHFSQIIGVRSHFYYRQISHFRQEMYDFLLPFAEFSMNLEEEYRCLKINPRTWRHN